VVQEFFLRVMFRSGWTNGWRGTRVTTTTFTTLSYTPIESGHPN